jgi:membrane protease YdiL (CAAX protease family)
MACHTIRPLLVYNLREALCRMFEPNSTIGWSIGRLHSTARDLLAFIRSPVIGARATWQDDRAVDVAWLFLLNCLIILAIATILFPMMMIFGVEMSSDMSDLFKRPVGQIMLFVVVIGPILEELMFRIWISGTPRLLIGFLGLIAWLGGSLILNHFGLIGSGQIAAIILIAIISIAVLVGLIRFWKSSVPNFYIRIFPFVFWGQALLFGFVHIFNYAGDNPVALLPFILPQLVGGLIWGYARIRYGWWSNIVMHMAYNLIATSGLLYVLLTQPNIS